MTSIVDNLHEAAGNMPQRSGKPANEAQRNAWLLQLEQAWMTNLGTHRAAAEPGRADAHTDTDRDMTSSMDVQSHAEGRSAFGASTPAHAAISASLRQNEPSSASHAASVNDAQAQEYGATQHTSSDASHPDAATQEIHDDKNASANEAGKFPSAAESFTTENDKGISPLKAAMPMSTVEIAHPLLMPAAMAATPADNAGTGNALQITAAAPLKASSTALWAAFSNMQPAPTGDTAANTVEQEDAPHAGRKTTSATQETASSQDQYAARNLHLYRNGNTVQAWLRDAELTDTSAHSVAQALQSELQRSALQLTALTVNGKRLPFPSMQEEEGGDGLRPSSQESSARHKTKAVQHIDQTAMNNGGATYGD